MDENPYQPPKVHDPKPTKSGFKIGWLEWLAIALIVGILVLSLLSSIPPPQRD